MITMNFYLSEIAKTLRPTQKYRIGFYLPKLPLSYASSMASTRLRVLDLISEFQSNSKYQLELYKPLIEFDIVVFQKMFYGKALKKAMQLKKVNTKVVLDINVNYFDKKSLKNTDQYLHESLLNFIPLTDAVITPSPYIKDQINKIFPSIPATEVHEHIEKTLLATDPRQLSQNEITIAYVGYSVKANEIYLIKQAIEKYAKDKNVSYLFVTEKSPDLSLKGVQIQYKKFDPQSLVRDLAGADIYLAPRDMSNSYNLGHSFTKIGIPMASGLPVIASPIPSYQNSPAHLIDTLDTQAWFRALEKITSSPKLYHQTSREGISHVKKNYSTSKIIGDYINLFDQLLL